MQEWLIIGGGIHGTHLANVLLGQVGVAPDRLQILDPHDRPLAMWDRLTSRTGMRYLRSPAVHHLDIHPRSLMSFARSSAGKRHARFFLPYDRPGMELFDHHNRWLIQRSNIDGRMVRGRAESLKAHGAGFRVETAAGSIETRRVLLAIGMSEQPAWPEWARDIRHQGGSIQHLFDPQFEARWTPDQHVLVMGGGLTATQFALSLAERHPGQVTLLCRHAARVHQFDSDPGWLGPKLMAGFQQLRLPAERRRTIATARHRGSVPAEVANAFKRAIRDGSLRHVHGDVRSAACTEDGLVRIETGAAQSLSADHVVLATGFESRRPGGEWLDAAIEEFGLRCSDCGYPIVNQRLEWHPGLFVTGPLAELEIGPIARNISGARSAGARIVAAA